MPKPTNMTPDQMRKLSAQLAETAAAQDLASAGLPVPTGASKAGRHRVVTHEAEEAFVRQLELGASRKEAAHAIGLSENTISTACKRAQRPDARPSDAAWYQRVVAAEKKARANRVAPAQKGRRTVDPEHYRHVIRCAILVDQLGQWAAEHETEIVRYFGRSVPLGVVGLATPEDLELTGAALVGKALECCRAHILPFAAHCYQGNRERLEPAWFHVVFADLLTTWATGYGERLMISCPTQHGKTEFSGRNLVAWSIGKWPDDRMGVGTYSATLASKTSRDAKRIIRSAEFQEVFPDVQLPDRKEQLSGEKIAQVDEWELSNHKGGFRGCGLGGSIAGYPVNRLSIDDPLKGRKEADSATIRERAWESINEDWKARNNPPDSVVLTGTRWHEDDPLGRFTAAMANEDTAEPWVIVTIPGILTREEDRCPFDPREIGDPLWPEGRRKKDDPPDIDPLILRDRALNMYRRAINLTPGGMALVQQQPKRREGEIIKRPWLQRRWRRPLPPGLQAVIVLDCKGPKLAAAQGPRTSFACAHAWADVKGEHWLLGERRGRWNPTDTAIEALLLGKELVDQGVAVKYYLVEDAAAGKIVQSVLSMAWSDDRGNAWSRQIVKMQKVDAAKAIRFAGVEHFFSGAQSMILLPPDLPWVPAWVEEHCGFTGRANEINDRVDTTTLYLAHVAAVPSMANWSARTGTAKHVSHAAGW